MRRLDFHQIRMQEKHQKFHAGIKYSVCDIIYDASITAIEDVVRVKCVYMRES